MSDIFYKPIDELNTDYKQLFIDAKEKSYKWRADILDCRISWNRMIVFADFYDILKLLDKKSFITIIHRKPLFIDPEHLEICFCTMSSPEYFLWIMCDMKHLDYFIKKYNLVLLT